MVYISSDGKVCQSPPWSIDRVGNSKSTSDRGSGSFFRGSGGGGGGGGGGRPGPGGGGGGPRFRTMNDINPPTVRGVGGCSGGSCGM